MRAKVYHREETLIYPLPMLGRSLSSSPVLTPPRLARVPSCAAVGLEGVIVEVEVDYSNGPPTIIIVGLPDAAVQESRERVQTAVRNAG